MLRLYGQAFPLALALAVEAAREPTTAPRVHPGWISAQLDRLDRLRRKDAVRAKAELAKARPVDLAPPPAVASGPSGGGAAKVAKVRRANSIGRRQAVLLVILGALVGTLLIVGFEHYRAPLRDWLLSEPGKRAHRMKLLLLLATAGLSAPLVAFAAYLWSLGSKVIQARQFPPPGYRVIHGTPIVGGQAAVLRGRSLKALALFLGVASALLWLFLWRLERVIQ